MTFQSIILTLTATATALMAGLFFAYTFSVNPGLHRLTDSAYLAAMQSINRAIQNPVFFTVFFGTLILLPLSAWLSYNQLPALRFWLLCAAAVIYAGGVFSVTVLGNVPLNEALDAFIINTATPEQLSAQRSRFEMPWNALNTIRTLASASSIILVIIAYLIPVSPKAAEPLLK